MQRNFHHCRIGRIVRLLRRFSVSECFYYTKKPSAKLLKKYNEIYLLHDWQMWLENATFLHHWICGLLNRKSARRVKHVGYSERTNLRKVPFIYFLFITRFISHVKSFTKWRIASAGWSQISVGKPGYKVQFLNATLNVPRLMVRSETTDWGRLFQTVGTAWQKARLAKFMPIVQFSEIP